MKGFIVVDEKTRKAYKKVLQELYELYQKETLSEWVERNKPLYEKR